MLEEFLAYSAAAGFSLRGLDFSPIRGPEGNIEYLAWLEKDGGAGEKPDIARLVEASHGAWEREDTP